MQRDTLYLSVFSPNAGKSVKNVDQNNFEYELFLRRVRGIKKKLVSANGLVEVPLGIFYKAFHCIDHDR